MRSIVLALLSLVGMPAYGTTLHHTPHRWGPPQFHIATVYSGECDGQTDKMADGTTIDERHGGILIDRHGKHVDSHALASNFLPLGAHIRFSHPVYGSTEWTVRDSGGAFDLYVPKCRYGSWGNPNLEYRVRLH